MFLKDFHLGPTYQWLRVKHDVVTNANAQRLAGFEGNYFTRPSGQSGTSDLIKSNVVLATLEEALKAKRVESVMVADETIKEVSNMLEHFGMSYPLATIMVDEPLARCLKFIRATTKMGESTMVTYGEDSGRVIAQGVLHHIKDVDNNI
ncbi:hypothetical protein GUJ93_ZPchr0001g29508 [Zizania palustris]|uniref:Uncharacterized protein n=1 Tax=Zizania palustris TaxID=103762 RepID=A0A8J5SAP1_ZIZPA|nr:hypothetical protein GUJ93_ZPchr0001g29508 [Zizania palustris]